MSGFLLDYLTREHAAICLFLELLEHEAEAMTQGDFTRLSGLATHKSELADQIARISREREAQQLLLGYAAGRRGADAAAAAGSKSVQDAWGNLLESATRAHASNHRNGVMIHTHLDFTRKSIGFLKASGQPLYGPDGSHESGSGSGSRLALG